MPTPSLILVPARFKTGKLYTPVATTSGGVVLGASGDFNVTRATTATRVNASGLVEVVASGIPRLDYPLGGGCPALLVEASGSNAFIQSQTLFTSHLVQNLTTAGYADVAISPDGTQNAEKFVPNTTNAAHRIADVTSQTITSGTTYTFSCFAKSDGGANFPFIALIFESSTAWGASKNAIFNVVSGTIHGSAPSGVTMRIENYGNGWYRFSATATAVNSATGQFQYRISIPDSSANLSYAAASGNTEGVLVWGAQLEVGSIATSYIPTTTAAVTRNPEVISLSGAVSGCIGQTEGTIYVDMIPPTGGTGVNAFLIGDGTSNNFVLLGRSGATLRGSIRANNSFILNDLTLSLGQTAIKAALAYKSGDYSLYANGSIVASGTTAFTFTSDIIGAGLTNNVDFTAPTITNRYNAYVLYPTRLTNSELAALTT